MFLFYTLNMYITCICPLGAISLTKLAKAIAKKRRFSFARIVHLVFWLCLFVFFFFPDIVRVLQKCVSELKMSSQVLGEEEFQKLGIDSSNILRYRFLEFILFSMSRLFPPKFPNTFSQFFSEELRRF
ncbi:hypothetical protein K0M31_013712 [Melipona bicolor]|uniref:Uncharacterized protein n=1 Tax=Melipona bicolor TaxID=60889 RepID=A0AA40FH37_9HYME|nr:hypothetical protein K0M31_013712 [Melipona bicolor]